MAEQIEVIDLRDLTVEEIQKLENKALGRLKEAASRPVEEFAMHQNASHTVHTDHVLNPA